MGVKLDLDGFEDVGTCIPPLLPLSNLCRRIDDAELPVKTAGFYLGQPLIPICSKISNRQTRERLLNQIGPHQPSDDSRLD